MQKQGLLERKKSVKVYHKEGEVNEIQFISNTNWVGEEECQGGSLERIPS